MTRVNLTLAARVVLWISAVPGVVLSGCSNDTAPTARSGGKAMATGDTEAASAWQPGDPIPGWEDYDCPEPEGAGYLELGLSDPIEVGPGEVEVFGDSAHAYLGHYFTAIVGECPGGGCGYDGSVTSLDGTSWVEMVYWNYSGDVSGRGQGPSGAPRDGVTVGFDGHTELLDWEVQGTQILDSARVEICVARLRPDALRWVVEVQPLALGGMATPFTAWYSGFVLRVTYEVSFPEHAACLESFDDPYFCVVPMGESQIGYYQISYDDAWPWDEITDPDIRDAVYERYTPWNSP